MHFQKLVDLFDLGAGAGGDALLAAGLEHIGLRRSFGVIESMIAHCRFSRESSRLAAAS